MMHTLMALDGGPRQSEISPQVIPITTRPIFKAFWTCEGPKCPKMGSKWVHFTRLCTRNGLG